MTRDLTNPSNPHIAFKPRKWPSVHDRGGLLKNSAHTPVLRTDLSDAHPVLRTEQVRGIPCHVPLATDTGSDELLFLTHSFNRHEKNGLGYSQIHSLLFLGMGKGALKLRPGLKL